MRSRVQILTPGNTPNASERVTAGPPSLCEIMFQHYKSLDEVMQGEGKHVVMRELNASSLYLNAVREMGYREIGIIVLDEEGREKYRYASCNLESGEIRDITAQFQKPNFIVKAKESVLMQILYDIEEIKAKPLPAILKYGLKFKAGRIQDHVQMGLILAHAHAILKRV